VGGTDTTSQPRDTGAVSLLRRLATSRLLWSLVFVVAIVLVMAFSTAGLSGQVRENQAEFLEDSVRRSAVQCYAIEGRFPPDLPYLEKNYNLTIDRSRYAVYYESMGANLLPQIRVVTAGK
jgi:hypothetical protein